MTEWVRIVGWVLLHFLWQGAVLVVITAIALRICSRATASLRYTVAVVGLSAMMLAPVVTAFVMASLTATGVPSTPAARGLSDAPGQVVTGIVGAWQSGFAPTTLTAIEPYFPFIVSLWIGGATSLLLVTFRNWWHVRRLHAAALAWPPSPWQAAANRLAQSLALRTAVRIVELPSIDVPAVLGWLRPVVGLPAALLAQLPPVQVEAILAHELAHVRRHDYLVNLLQRLAEAVLFYHPGIWWVCARIREEREHCCDDVAIEMCGDPDAYAVALAECESRRRTTVDLVVAATDGPLLRRIRRILRVATPDRIAPPNWSMTIVLAAVFALMLGGPQRSPVLLAHASVSAADALASPFRARWSGPAGNGSITSTGTIVFTDDLRDIAGISSGGSIAVESRGFLSSRRVEMAMRDGRLQRRYYVNGSERPWSEEPARWLADELPFLVRRSGISAHERVHQVRASSGVSAVLNEIGLLYTDSVRARYFQALFESGRLEPADLDAAFRLAGNVIESSAELSSSLQTAVAARLYDSDAFFYAASRISSSAEKSELLGAVLARSELNTARQVDVLNVAATIESNAACSEVLAAFLARYRAVDAEVRGALLAALGTIESDAERARLSNRMTSDVR